MNGRPGWRAAALAAMTTIVLLGLVWMTALVVIMVAATQEDCGFLPFETCQTGAGTERVIVGALVGAAALTTLVLVWGARRARRERGPAG